MLRSIDLTKRVMALVFLGYGAWKGYYDADYAAGAFNMCLAIILNLSFKDELWI